jgi:predicted ATP-dependent endonuclease of OLD family
MKLESITVQNFKGIRRKAVIPLAPVTMLFGANSSGRSRILNAFLYLYELLVNKNADPEYSTVTGEHIYLGGGRAGEWQGFIENRNVGRYF